MMNGALTIGTLDGATVEIAEEAGKRTCFFSVLPAEQVVNSRGWYKPRGTMTTNRKRERRWT
jgi:starch phosphorylase